MIPIYASLSLALLIGSDAKSSRELLSLFNDEVISQSGSFTATKNGGAGNSSGEGKTTNTIPLEQRQIVFPTPAPSPNPSESPSVTTPSPTTNPTVSPTVKTDTPTPAPTDPTASQTDSPKPSPQPSASPTNKLPSATPTDSPEPSPSPSASPTISSYPTQKPTFGIPTASPAPTAPSATPTASPAPSPAPSETPTVPLPSVSPTSSPAPSPSPTRITPTASPTASPAPSSQPTASPGPSPAPSDSPTTAESLFPTVSEVPTSQPTASPAPTPSPSQNPSKTTSPSVSTEEPTGMPTFTNAPSTSDSPSVTVFPSEAPSLSQVPSQTIFPSTAPSLSVVPSVTSMPSACPNVKFYQVKVTTEQTCSPNCNAVVSCNTGDFAIASGWERNSSGNTGKVVMIRDTQESTNTRKVVLRSTTANPDYSGFFYAICATGCFTNEVYASDAADDQTCSSNAGDIGDCNFDIPCNAGDTAIGGSYRRLGGNNGHNLLLNFFGNGDTMTMDVRSSRSITGNTVANYVMSEARAICIKGAFSDVYQVESDVEFCNRNCVFNAQCSNGDVAINGFFQRSTGNNGAAMYISSYPISTGGWSMMIRSSIESEDGQDNAPRIAGKLIDFVPARLHDLRAIGGSYRRLGGNNGHNLLLNFFGNGDTMTMDVRSSRAIAGTVANYVMSDARAMCIKGEFSAVYQVESDIETCDPNCVFNAQCSNGDLAINGFFQRSTGNDGAAIHINSYPKSMGGWKMTITSSSENLGGTATGDDITGKLIVLCTSEVANPWLMDA
eukprot:CAMPEP_0194262564 /NCGR_PEP_ID=MMETSP0158-20130606/46608_1 /TAXON_ID=33649 /ORGANISM="Thalassionema nitzschioides, Strain L26-B" /LENGTH=780 /DNA_ID=CAMNT_0039002723 /DNA_START=71 /DNA_END=2414 /DNA_ORIENTATION=+